MSSRATVEMQGVRRTFPGNPPVEAVKPTDLTIAEGEYVAVVGPSGSGKSTLLHLIGCLDRPTDGRYELRGVDVGRLPDARRSAVRGKEIGFVFQTFHLLGHRTVLENVMMGMLYNQTPRSDRRGLAVQAIERVGLSQRIDFLAAKLSGGEKQRVAIARAVASGPSLLLCDEPTGNLDTDTSERILDLFDELRDLGLTLVVVTHDESVSAHADRRILMIDGVIAA